MEHGNLNPRQESFLHKYMFEHKPAGVAYAEAYQRDVDDTAYTNASRLLRNAQVKGRLLDMRSIYVRDAMRSYQKQWDLVESPTTPPQVKVKILSGFLDRAGL